MSPLVSRLAIGVVAFRVDSAIYLSALAVLAMALAIKRPAYVLALLIISDPFDFSRRLFLTDVNTTKVILVGAIIGLLVKRDSLRALSRSHVRPIVLAGIGLAAAELLTLAPAVYLDAVFRETIKTIEYIAIFAVGAIAYAKDPGERLVWAALSASVLLVSGLALCDEHGGVVSIGGKILARIAGPLEGPNQLAGFYDVAGPLLLARAVAGRSISACILFCVIVMCDVLTLSRGGLLGLLGGVIAVYARLPAKRLGGGLVVAAVLTAVAPLAWVAHRGGLSRYTSYAQDDLGSGLGTRWELWSAALSIFRTHPLLGIGAGNFELELSSLGLVGIRTHANSLYLQSLAEGGLPLFVATLAVIGVALANTLFSKKHSALLVGAGAATIALAVHQVVDDLTFFPKVGGFWWLWLGIASASGARTGCEAHDGGARSNGEAKSERGAAVNVGSRATRVWVFAVTCSAVVAALISSTWQATKKISQAPMLNVVDGVSAPIGVVLTLAQRQLPEVNGLYPADATRDPLCCWLAPDARIVANRPAGVSELDVALLIPGFAFFQHGGQHLTLIVGKTVRSISFREPGFQIVSLPLAGSDLYRGGDLTVRIRARRIFVPASEGVSSDERKLAVVLRGIAFH